MKPCPFCGCDVIETFQYPWGKKPNLRGCYVYCANCGARSGKHETVQRAMKAWNERKVQNEKGE